MGPWSRIAKQNRQQIEVLYSQRPCWADVRQSDIVFMQRPSTVEWIKAAEACKHFEVPLWVDWDDDIFSLPRDNPTYRTYSKLLPIITEFIQMADLVTSSTKFLAHSLGLLNQRVEVLPNVLDPALYKFRSNAPKNNMVLWRGTATHERDVASVAPQLVRVAQANPSWTFCFVGADPYAWEVSEKMPNVVRITEQMDPATFFGTICTLNPKVLIAPLHDNKFNRSKSNIAALEGALAGAAVVAPNWEEWRIPGVNLYETPAQFESHLSHLLSDEGYRTSKADDLWQSVWTDGWENSCEVVDDKRIALAELVVRSR